MVEPESCLERLAAFPNGGLLTWQQLVDVEHCDRIKRLRRLSALTQNRGDVEFFEASVLADDLPAEINRDIPILRVVFRERVFFDTDSSVLRQEAHEIVDIISESLRREPPDVAMFVSGHADKRGSKGHNLNLSVSRANALSDEVLRRGVNVASVWRVGFGEDMPLVPGDSDYAYGQNRRIEFLFAAKPEAVAAWLPVAQLDLLCQGATREETEACRVEIDFETEYVAEEVVTASVALDLPSGDDVGVQPETGRGAVELETEKVEVALKQPRRIRIDPTNGEYRAINPVNVKSTKKG